MRVLIGAFGTRGDVQPMMALAEALTRRGHSISVAVPPNSVAFARRFAAGAVGVGLDYEDLSRRAAHGNFAEMRQVMPLVREEIAVQLAVLEPMAAEADVIIGSSVFTVGTILSERLGKPYVFVCFCPQIIPSAAHPSPFVRYQRLPRWLNRASWAVNAWVWNRLLRERLDEERAARGLPATVDAWQSLMGPHPVLACSPALAPMPHDFPEGTVQPGALLLEDRDELSAEVQAFLEAGPSPVYIGFGSMSDPDPTRTTQRLVSAAKKAGVRAIISRGWAKLGVDDRCEGVFFAGPEPHAKLFPRCSVIVHHGGAGTTHAAARSGVPQVVLPQLLDQHYWANRVRELGIGPPPVKRHGADPEQLTRAVRICLDGSEVRERARRLSERIELDGTTQACQAIEKIVERDRP